MKIFKRFVSILMSVSILVVGSFTLSMQVNAEVYTPEIVKTETWTTSYYIDDEVDTLYPYIECKADIYSDGSMKVGIRNTHEWNGFRTVYHYCTIPGTKIVKQYESIYLAKKGLYKNWDKEGNYYFSLMEPDPSLEDIDISYYNVNYECRDSISWRYKEIGAIKSRDSKNPNSSYGLSSYSWYGYLCDFDTTRVYEAIFTPMVEPMGTYDFRIFGHDIIITPELLSTTDFTVQENEQTQMIHELESRINDLNTELEQLRAEKEVWKNNEAHLLEDLEILYKENEVLVARRGDINDDGLFTVADAVLLMRYVAGTIDTIPYKKIN